MTLFHLNNDRESHVDVCCAAPTSDSEGGLLAHDHHISAMADTETCLGLLAMSRMPALA